MVHPLQHITDLSEICFHREVAHVVISPGSRNAPLINAFYKRFGRKCISLVDERSAAYVGLGLARQSQKPVVLVCTSGTAVINYGPALAEAYYQRIPLIAVTADRPSEWIDQQDNQTIRQKNIFNNYTLGAFNFPEQFQNETSLFDSLKKLEGLLDHGVRMMGPVHVNVPLREPLYGDLPQKSKYQSSIAFRTADQPRIPKSLFDQWIKARSILIIHGQGTPDSVHQKSLSQLSEDSRVVLIAENLSNINHSNVIHQPEIMLSRLGEHKLTEPDLLLYSGGQVVSKRLKTVIRSMRIAHTWRIGLDDFPIDTFKMDNQHLDEPASGVYQKLCESVDTASTTQYKSQWLSFSQEAQSARDQALNGLPFSDVSVLGKIIPSLPGDSILELGNSSVVRYAQLLPDSDKLQYNSNRGVSGIDGCLSSAVGTAMACSKTVTAVLGDLSFVYDSNALWNRELPSNLKIVVLNNKGGGIFGLIPGPSGQDAFEDFFVAHHPVNIQKLADAFDLHYFCIRNNEEVMLRMKEFIEYSVGPAIMEVKTDRDNNELAFRKLLGIQ